MRGTTWLGLVFVMGLGFSGLRAEAPPFEYPKAYATQILITANGRTATLKCYANGTSTRTEVTTDRGTAVTIMRGDRKVVLQLDPARKQYTETPFTEGQKPLFLGPLEDATAKWQPIGIETVDAIQCEKYKCTTSGPKKMELTYYISTLDKVPVREVWSYGDINSIREYKEFLVGAPDKALFDVPKDYVKAASAPDAAAAR